MVLNPDKAKAATLLPSLNLYSSKGLQIWKLHFLMIRKFRNRIQKAIHELNLSDVLVSTHAFLKLCLESLRHWDAMPLKLTCSEYSKLCAICASKVELFTAPLLHVSQASGEALGAD